MFTCRRTLLNKIYSTSTHPITHGNIPTELASFVSIATSTTAAKARPRVRRHSKPKVTPTANFYRLQQSRCASTRARYVPIPVSSPKPGPSTSKHSEPSQSSSVSKSRTRKRKERKEKMSVSSGSSSGDARVTLDEYLKLRGDTSGKRKPFGNPNPQKEGDYRESRLKIKETTKISKGKDKATESENPEQSTMSLRDYHTLIVEASQTKNDRALNWLVSDIIELPETKEELEYSPNPFSATTTEETPSISSSPSTDSTTSTPLYHTPGYEEPPKNSVLPQLNSNSIPFVHLSIPPHLELPPLEPPSSSSSFSSAFSTSTPVPLLQSVDLDIYTSRHTFLHHILFSLDLSRLWGETTLGILRVLSSTFVATSSSTNIPTASSTPSLAFDRSLIWIDSLPYRRFRWLVVQLCTRVHPRGVYSASGEGNSGGAKVAEGLADDSAEEGDEDTDLALLRLVYPRVLQGVLSSSLPERADIEGPPDQIYLGFMTLGRLLQTQGELRLPQEAIDLFTQLLQGGWIPIEAVYSMPESEAATEEGQEKLRTVLSMTLVRACVKWNLRTLGMRALDGMLARLAPASSSSRSCSITESTEQWSPIETCLVDLVPLTQDVLYASLASPRPSEFRACVELIKRLSTLATLEIAGAGVEDIGLDGLIRTCYTVGMEGGFISDCVGLYAFTRGYGRSGVSAPEPQGRQLTGPPGQVVLWILKGVVVDGVGARPEVSPRAVKVRGGAQSWLARELACEVAGIPSTSRPFDSTSTSVPPLPPIFLPAPIRAEFIALTASQGFATATRVLYTRYSKGKDRALVVGSPAVLTRAVGCFESVRKMQEAKAERRGVISRPKARELDDHDQIEEEDQEDREDLPLDELYEGELLDTQVYREREQDLRGFLDHIINSYVEVCAPLENAKHEIITSLARAYFIVGKIRDGFDAFKVLLQRNEIPDMHDMNTALTVLAEDSPRSAAKLVSRMVARGIQPDSVTLGILLKWALAHGDQELVRDILSRWGHLGLDMKGLDMWIRGSIEQAGGKKEAVRDAYELLRDLSGEGHGIARNVGLGKYLVLCALRAGDVMLGRAVFRDLVCTTGDREMEFMRQLLKK